LRRGSLVGLVAGLALLTAACGAEGSPKPSVAFISPAASAPAEGWTRRANAPIALTEVAAAEHEGRIWVAGGLDATGKATDRVSVFDPAADTWVAGPALPEPIHHSALVSDGESLWLIGGYVGNAFDRPTEKVWQLQADNWIEHFPLPEPRAAGAAAWDGAGRILYAGGVGPGGVSPVVFGQGDHGWEELARLFAPREHLAATSDGAGTVFVLGGRRGGLEGNVATVELVSNGAVRRVADLATARGGVAAFFWPALGACLVGGESVGGTNPEVECITADGRQSRLPDLRSPRHGLGAAVVDGSLYVVLGGERPGLFVSDEVEAFELP
jgi:non-specific serine/threonine protein kinase